MGVVLHLAQNNSLPHRVQGMGIRHFFGALSDRLKCQPKMLKLVLRLSLQNAQPKEAERVHNVVWWFRLLKGLDSSRK